MIFKNNKNLFVIAIIAIVNALGYGIIIPVLYTYSQKYGLTDFQNGLLFSIFSLCQFIATPVIGRMSDKYGRRPMLLISLIGTAISFFMMAFAPSALFLFLARALDGITAGNIPVASAVISDTTPPKDRTKGFAIIGASFGFGFIFGPAISAATVGFSTHLPFIIAGTITFIAILLTYFLLPETNKHMGEIGKGPVIDIKKLILAVTDIDVGKTLIISLCYSFAFSLYIYTYQPFATKILGLSATQISLMFTLFGIVGLLSQVVLLPQLTKRIKEPHLFTICLTASACVFLALFLSRTFILYAIIGLVQSFTNSSINTLIQTLLSKETDEKSQGSILGLNSSYISIGMIIGPIVGGIVATYWIPLPFLIGSIAISLCAVLSISILRRHHAKQSAFSPL